LTLLALTFCIIALLFLGRFNTMATDIGPLAAGLDGRLGRLGIGRTVLRKTWRNSRLGALTFSIVDS
jgi:hypothetical protein